MHLHPEIPGCRNYHQEVYLLTFLNEGLPHKILMITWPLRCRRLWEINTTTIMEFILMRTCKISEWRRRNIFAADCCESQYYTDEFSFVEDDMKDFCDYLTTVISQRLAGSDNVSLAPTTSCPSTMVGWEQRVLPGWWRKGIQSCRSFVDRFAVYSEGTSAH
jgi:hypothetical protein